MKNIPLPFRQGAPCLWLHMIFVHCMQCRLLLKKGMDFNLIYGRRNRMVQAKISQSGRVKIAYADCAKNAFPVLAS